MLRNNPFGYPEEMRDRFTGVFGSCEPRVGYRSAGNVEVGVAYLVSPTDPQKKKHRGRTVEVLEISHNWDWDWEQEDIPDVWVTFLDTKRIGKVDGNDLVHI
jgi:hypothetical protein